ncbi:MAG: hypothetical protein LBI87_00670 [Candidatus Accumulibacter sp.]|jgi:hypothetical protein|nr:hypothetical protein [Accumulibacter sp.]
MLETIVGALAQGETISPVQANHDARDGHDEKRKPGKTPSCRRKPESGRRAGFPAAVPDTGIYRYDRAFLFPLGAALAVGKKDFVFHCGHRARHD